MRKPSTLQWAVIGSLIIHALALSPLPNINFHLKQPKSERMAAMLLPPSGKAAKPVSRARSKKPPPPRSEAASAVPAKALPPAPAAPPIEEIKTAPESPAAKPTERDLPSHGQLVFDVSRGEERFILGTARYQWKIEEGRYVIHSIIQPTGIVALFTDAQYEQTSSGRFGNTGFVPEDFRDIRKGKEYTARFEWEEGKLMLGDGREFPVDAGAQDLLSVFYQFSFFTLNQPEFGLMVTNGRKYVHYTFRVSNEEVVLADGTAHPAYHLRYQAVDGEAMEVWLASDLARLPVRIRYIDRKGGIIELLATEANYQGKQ